MSCFKRGKRDDDFASPDSYSICTNGKFDKQLWEAKVPRTAQELMRAQGYDVDTAGKLRQSPQTFQVCDTYVFL